MKRSKRQAILACQRVVRKTVVLLEFQYRFVPEIERIPPRTYQLELHDEMQWQPLVERVFERMSKLNLEIRLQIVLSAILRKLGRLDVDSFACPNVHTAPQQAQQRQSAKPINFSRGGRKRNHRDRLPGAASHRVLAFLQECAHRRDGLRRPL